MKGDFTRSTFTPAKHYTSVRMQQGRVPMDADWNEAQDIGKHLDETTRIDVIGRCGFPEDDAGFGLVEATPTAPVRFGAGKGYVNGILCVNDRPVSLTDQPHLPGYALPETDGTYLAYLDVWERHITALEDPTIKEVALGGPDTATRLQTIWQIKLAAIERSDDGAPPDCADYQAWVPSDRTGTGRMKARAALDPTDERPCIVPAQAGYRRLENQLYRVEIHQGGAADTATLKWSRDNGSIVSAWNGPDAPDTQLAVSTIGRDNVLRFSANQWVELSSDATELNNQPGQLARVNQAEGQRLEIDRSVDRTDFVGNPKVRRWDHVAEGGAIALEEGRWLTLESGVQVWFEPGGSYHTGDYWLIPARTIGATVVWPQNDSGTDDGDGSEDPAALTVPDGIQHRYCALGLLQRTNGTWEQLQDCRPLFPPLTDLPLNTQACGEITVSPEDDLQSVIDRIPAGGDAKLCLHPGLWRLNATVTIANKGSLVISGAGSGTQLFGQRLDRCLLFRNCASVTVRDLQVIGGNLGEIGDGLQGTLSFIDCGAVTLENLQVSCNTFLSRRVSTVQIWARTQPKPTDAYIRHCRMTVGHQQTGLLIINGGQVNIENNVIDAPGQPFNLRALLANAQDPAIVAAVGRSLMHRIVVGNENLPPDASEALVGGPVGILSEPNANGQYRIIASLTKWGQPFAFYTDARMSQQSWRALLEANPIRSRSGPSPSEGVVATRLRQLRARLVRRLFGNTTVDVTIPSISLIGLEPVSREIEQNNRLGTGSQGIVIGGDRTPTFGSRERFANGLFVTGGSLTPTATVTNNKIIGFAEGIHIGTSNRSPKYYRSYQLKLEGNVIQLRATSLVAERHGIFVGHAHSLNIQGNTIQVIDPPPPDWNYRQGQNITQRPIPPTDGIHLNGVYGPLLFIQQNHTIGVTRGIVVTARNAGLHESRFGIVPAWSVANNAYAGLGQAQVLSAMPASRL